MTDWKTLIPIFIAILSALGGTGALVGWNTTSQELHSSHITAARRLAKYHFAKQMARDCLGEAVFDVEWANVLMDLNEAEEKLRASERVMNE